MYRLRMTPKCSVYKTINALSRSYSRYAVAITLVSVLAVGVVFAASSMSANILAKFTEQEKQYKLPAGILGKVAKIESNGNTNAQPQGGSTATGLFQWTKNSWLEATNALYGYTKVLELRTNPFVSTEVTAFALAKTRTQLGGLIAQAGVDQSVGLYMGHFLGPGGAKKFLGYMIQNKDAPAAPYFPVESKANHNIFYSGKARTFAEIINFFAAKMSQPGVTSVPYTGTLGTLSGAGRIMDEGGDAGLAQTYPGPVPTSDPEYSYPSSYTSAGSNDETISPYTNNNNQQSHIASPGNTVSHPTQSNTQPQQAQQTGDTVSGPSTVSMPKSSSATSSITTMISVTTTNASSTTNTVGQTTVVISPNNGTALQAQIDQALLDLITQNETVAAHVGINIYNPTLNTSIIRKNVSDIVVSTSSHADGTLAYTYSGTTTKTVSNVTSGTGSTFSHNNSTYEEHAVSFTIGEIVGQFVEKIRSTLLYILHSF